MWGIFPFDWEDPNPGYQEIDIVEDSYWSGYADMVGKYTYYPGDENSGIHLNDRVWTLSGKGATVRMTWMPGTIRWETWESHLTEERARNTPVNEGGYYSGTLTQTVPVPRSQRVHINLWAFKGKGGWETMPPTTMHLKSFKFTPWEGSYGVQMGENGVRPGLHRQGRQGGRRHSLGRDSHLGPAPPEPTHRAEGWGRRLRRLDPAGGRIHPHAQRPGQR